MPLLLPFATGFIVGVCVAPTVRQHAHLRPVFSTLDALQTACQEAFLVVQTVAHAVAGREEKRPPRLYDPS